MSNDRADAFMWATILEAHRKDKVISNKHQGCENAIDINKLVTVAPPPYARENRECAV